LESSGFFFWPTKLLQTGQQFDGSEEKPEQLSTFIARHQYHFIKKLFNE